ncbi:hypothetical protein SSU98_0190 [Streptococcus suis 98HAH33]|nr:hypothetical protein SSU98_0190 [Streptococcus suis 98HAH33]
MLVIVVGGGANIIVGSLEPFGQMYEPAFNLKGVVPHNEAIVTTGFG